MKTRGLRLAVLGLVLLGAAACDDNPLADNREQGTRFILNPTNGAVVSGGDSIIVSAVLVNEYGAPTGTAVSAEGCDARVSVDKSPQRLEFEPPERFVVKASGNLGMSCVVVRAGSVTDTIHLRVVPASLRVILPQSAQSGEEIVPTVQFLDASGNPLTGFTSSDVTFTVATIGPAGGATARVVSNEVFAYWPGEVRVNATLGHGFPITAADTMAVTAATLNPAWLSTNSGMPGQLVTIKSGAAVSGEPGVVFNGKSAFVHAHAGDSMVVAIGAPGPENEIVVTGLDPFVVYAGEFEVLTPIEPGRATATWDIWEWNLPPATTTNNTRSFSNPALTSGVPAYMNMHISNDRWDYILVQVDEPGEYDLRLDWFDDSDNEIWVYATAGYAGEDVGTYPGCETSSGEGPEACVMTITEPGPYWLRVLKLGDDSNHSWTPVRVIATRR